MSVATIGSAPTIVSSEVDHSQKVVALDIAMLQSTIALFRDAPEMQPYEPTGDERDVYTRDGLLGALATISAGDNLPAPLPPPPEAPPAPTRKERISGFMHKLNDKLGRYLGFDQESWDALAAEQEQTPAAEQEPAPAAARAYHRPVAPIVRILDPVYYDRHRTLNFL